MRAPQANGIGPGTLLQGPAELGCETQDGVGSGWPGHRSVPREAGGLEAGGGAAKDKIFSSFILC